MNDISLYDLPVEALRHLAAEFAALASIPSTRPASGWGAWWLYLVSAEWERRQGRDVGLPPEIVGLDDLYEAELRALRDYFGELALLADLHGEDAMTGWCRKFVGHFDAELDRREHQKADLQTYIDEYRRHHPRGRRAATPAASRRGDRSADGPDDRP